MSDFGAFNRGVMSLTSEALRETVKVPPIAGDVIEQGDAAAVIDALGDAGWHTQYTRNGDHLYLNASPGGREAGLRCSGYRISPLNAPAYGGYVSNRPEIVRAFWGQVTAYAAERNQLAADEASRQQTLTNLRASGINPAECGFTE